MLKNLTMPGKIVLAILVSLIIYGGYYALRKTGIVAPSAKESQIIETQPLPPLPYDRTASAKFVPCPDILQQAPIQSPEVRFEFMAWNAQMGFMRAVGGPITSVGSFFADAGIRARVIRQDDCGKQGEDLYTFAAAYKAGDQNPAKGCQYIAWMGDGVAPMVTGLNERIDKDLGPEYRARVFYFGGSSYGEDKVMGSPIYLMDPQKLRGAVCAAVLRDGDFNIGVLGCNALRLPINYDPTTYDPDAFNWMAADTYLNAVVKYNEQTSETREIVRNGKRTGRDTTITATLVATWTPGDVNVWQHIKNGCSHPAHQSGVVTIWSTADNGAQMPNAIIGIDKYMKDHAKQVVDMIEAIGRGSDQVKAHTKALECAAQVSDRVYQDANLRAGDWARYYRGDTVSDGHGNNIVLGGSRVWNLADNAAYIGLTGGADKYKVVYETFGAVSVKAYPEVIKSFQPYEQAVDFSYLRTAWDRNKGSADLQQASAAPIRETDQMTTVSTRASLTIEFPTNSVEIPSAYYADLDEFARQVAIKDNNICEVNGHTDNTGDPDANQRLSEQRAASVMRYITRLDPSSVARVHSAGFGDTRPVGDNGTTAGRKKNRRVEIVFGRK